MRKQKREAGSAGGRCTRRLSANGGQAPRTPQKSTAAARRDGRPPHRTITHHIGSLLPSYARNQQKGQQQGEGGTLKPSQKHNTEFKNKSQQAKSESRPKRTALTHHDSGYAAYAFQDTFPALDGQHTEPAPKSQKRGLK